MLKERKGDIVLFRVETQEIGRIRHRRINIEETFCSEKQKKGIRENIKTVR